jgi:hypothetical protein
MINCEKCLRIKNISSIEHNSFEKALKTNLIENSVHIRYLKRENKKRIIIILDSLN